MQAVIQILKQHQAELNTNLTQTRSIVLEKRPGTEEIVFRDSTSVQGAIDNSAVSAEKYAEISTKIQEKGIEAELEHKMPQGSPFGDYGEVDNVLTEGKSTLRHELGEVLLVDVWATWCGPCQKPMQHNQEMLQKNEALWHKKVRIVALSVDDSKQSVVKRINDRGWTKIQHVTLNGWDGNHKLIKDFAISGIPFVCLVDKFGKIRFQGHPSSINLEQKINEFIAEQTQTKVQASASAAPQSEVPNQDITKWISVESAKNEFPKTGLLCLKAEISRSYNKGIFSGKSTIDAYLWEGDNESINHLKAVFKGAPLKINEVKYVSVPQLPEYSCWSCKTVLSFPFYWLKWEESTQFGCKNCIEQQKSPVEGHHFFYNKNSVYLGGPWQKIALKGLGNNLQPQDISKTGGHGFSCNGCGKTSANGQARYISLGCRSDPNFRGDYVDLCQKCFKKVDTEEVINCLIPDGHVKNHPFLRILYNTKGYYEY